MMSRTVRVGLFLVPVLMAGAWGAVLRAEAPVASLDGKTVVVPIALSSSGDAEVAGLQCDVLLEGGDARYEGADLGPSGRSADKALSTNAIGRGKVRLILVGLNQNAISDGVVAELRYRITDEAQALGTPVLSGVILSDPYGVRVPEGGEGVAGTPLASQASERGASAWVAVLLLGVVCGAIFVVTRAARRRRQPRHGDRRPPTQHRRKTKPC